MFHFAPPLHKRSELLDCVRAVAVILVIVFHVSTVDIGASPLDPVAGWVARVGFLGVDIFFPLSGFLITTFLLKHAGNAAIGTFFLRRFFRIVPLYALAVLTFIVAALVTGIDADLIDRTWINALFLTGWYIFSQGSETVPYTITWSLSVEEFAYILFGLMAWILRRHFVSLLWAVTLFALVLRFYLHSQGADNVYYFPPARLDSIAIGGLLAVGHHKGWTRLPLIFGALALLAFAVAQLGQEWRQTMLFLKLTLITCVVISLIQSHAVQWRSRPTWPFAVIGFYSYFIYLFHYFVIYGLDMVLDRVGVTIGFWPFSLAVIGLSTGAGYLSYALFEGPMMALGRRLEPKSTAPGPRTAPAE